jgi:predicted molibdopterin-dependent oxidoreductase YjgC
MIQRDRDPLTGADRDHVFVAPSDAAKLGIADGDPVLVKNAHGEMRGRAKIAEVAAGTLQAHWPEANVLIPSGRVDEDGGVPDYNARSRSPGLRPVIEGVNSLRRRERPRRRHRDLVRARPTGRVDPEALEEVLLPELHEPDLPEEVAPPPRSTESP